MNDDPIFSRAFEFLTEESLSPERWLYLSFADSEFRGAVVVKAQGITSAVLRVNALKINPGGEVLCVEFPEEKVPELRFCDRLLSKPEIQEMWGEPCKSLREWEAEDPELVAEAVEVLESPSIYWRPSFMPDSANPTDPIQPLDPDQTALAEQQATHHNFLVRNLVSLDDELNVLTGGLPDETVSARMARWDTEDKGIKHEVGEIMSKGLDLFEKDHGAKAEAGDDARAKEVEQVEDKTGELP